MIFNSSFLIFNFLRTGLLLIAISLIGCNSALFQESQKIPNKNWERSHTIRFDVQVEDTMKGYDFYIDLRNEGTYPSLAVLVKDVGDQVQKYGTLSKVPAEAVGNTRNASEIFGTTTSFLKRTSDFLTREPTVLNLNKECEWRNSPPFWMLEFR